MIQEGNKCFIKEDAIGILPLECNKKDKWTVTGVWGNEIGIQRILLDDRLEEIIYLVIPKMLTIIE